MIAIMRQCVKEDESSEYEDTTGDRAKLHQVKISSGIPKITSGDIYKKKKKNDRITEVFVLPETCTCTDKLNTHDRGTGSGGHMAGSGR